MQCMVLYFLNEERNKHKIESVTFKYSERGHNQSIVDTIHHLLEHQTLLKMILITRLGNRYKKMETRDSTLTLGPLPLEDPHSIDESIGRFKMTIKVN